MKILSLLSAALIIVSANANADSACLARASNDELLRELGIRLNTTDPVTPAESAILTLSCLSNYFKITSILAGSVVNSVEVRVDSSASCNEIATSLNAISNREIKKSMIISACTSNYLRKYFVATTGNIKFVEETRTDSNSSCMTSAVNQNKTLRL